jgi:hypothetical protein
VFTPSPSWNRDPTYLYPGHPVIPRFDYPGSKCGMAKRIASMLPSEGDRFVKRGQQMEWVETCTALSGNPHLSATNVHLVEPLLCYSGGYYGSSGPKSRGSKKASQTGFWRQCGRAGDIMRTLRLEILCEP